jgi:GMP synthase (glutamine-hydrolysing)
VRVHWLQHVPFEGLGSIAPWLAARGDTVTMSRLYAGDPLPEPQDYDWLIAMGGPMNVDRETEYPWLAREKRCVAQALAAGKRVLGICLGAQLMARALGAPVTPGTPEIGWFDVMLTAAAAQAPLFADFPRRFPAFHWHGDGFAIPRGGAHAATSDACPNQAFIYGERAVGLQFHLETTPASAAALIRHCGDELVDAPTVQPAATLLAEPGRFAELNRLMDRLLARLAAAG